MPESSTLPAGFAALEPYVDAWAHATNAARLERRMSSSMDEIEAFYNTMLPLIEAALAQGGVSAEEIDEVIFGQVLTTGQGQNPTRQAAVNAGIPKERTAFTINQVCGSGLRTVALAAQAIQTGDARIMLAGGFKGTFALEYEAGPLNGVEGAKYLYKEVLAALTTPTPVI